jgi:Flp pilus assembly CpaE family ATPase
VFARDLLRLRDVEAGLGAKVAHELPYDPFLYLKAVNEGVPLVWGASRSAPAEALLRLAAAAFNETRASATLAPADRRTGRLTGLLRRP